MSAPVVSEEPVLPDEVVTSAHVRYLELPGVGGEFALITLDNGLDHTRPSTFGPGGLASLDAALDDVEAHQPAVTGIGVTGKPFVFAVGADLSGIGLITTRDQAAAIADLGHRVFRRLHDAGVPTFAFVNGAALGGGLELALHCHYRTLARSVSAIAFPEVFLGIVPGWGGTQLLPPLIGPEAAVTVIVENPLNQNRMLRAGAAAKLGIVDALLDDADFLAESLRWAGRIITGEAKIDRPSHLDDDWDAALARGRAIADQKLHGAAPAPYRALELIALSRTGDFRAGTTTEGDVLADLIMTPEFRSGLYAFDLVQKRARRPVGAPDRSLARPVTKVGILGAGLMAGQLALLFARRLQVPVVLTDVDAERLERGVGYVHNEIAQLAARGRLSADQASRLTADVTGSLDQAAFADADFVVEAVFEQLDVKRQVFAELERFVRPDAVLATNTSSLSVSEIAAGLTHPERVVGFHFFNPVAVLPLLEIIRGEQTDDATLATAFATGRALGKSSVLVKDAPAFVVNRLLTRFLGEVLRCVDEGTPIPVADAALNPLGLPMSPMLLLTLVGPPIALHVTETLHTAFGDRFPISPTLRGLVEAGKSSAYLWDESGQHLDPDVAALAERVVAEAAPTDPAPTGDQVRERALAALADEIRRLLDDGVVAAAADVDLCLLLGAGWPFHLGGITPYLDRAGLAVFDGA
jgi:3-hydroxyacyl-CoA dehydrogenase/enoyl-CoA hydratase/carnithine racemase